jgi:phage tail-like protein
MAEALSDYPLPAFHFALRFSGASGALDTAFQEVSGIGAEMETETYREGGENRFVHQLPKGVKATRLVLKRGIAALDSPLVNWCKAVLESGLGTAVETKSVQVALLNELSAPVRVWSFDSAWPVKWSVEAFGAKKNEVAIESIELNYAASRREL